jgi:hypothetical protein
LERASSAGCRICTTDKDYLCTIIGVAGNVKTSDLAERNPIGQIYFAADQYPSRYLFLAVKSRANDTGIAAAVRREFAKADPELPLFDVKTMEQRLAMSVRERRAAMTICAAFAALALVLSAIGIYGVLAYTVSQRTREFGIRIALGARGGTVVGMVMGQGIRLAAIGLTLGVAGGGVADPADDQMLYDVKPTRSAGVRDCRRSADAGGDGGLAGAVHESGADQAGGGAAGGVKMGRASLLALRRKRTLLATDGHGCTRIKPSLSYPCASVAKFLFFADAWTQDQYYEGCPWRGERHMNSRTPSQELPDSINLG